MQPRKEKINAGFEFVEARGVIGCAFYSHFQLLLHPQPYVVSVLDGDTIEVLHNTYPERIRLSGIDCPEKRQAYGNNAKHAASALVFGKDIILDTHGQDKYRRTLADVFLRDGTHVNHTLVKDGWCWWYRKDAPGDAVLERLETEARESKKGLWVDPKPVPPWEWRKRSR
jgi:endonuclease YncB( thermonuclease family)